MRTSAHTYPRTHIRTHTNTHTHAHTHAHTHTHTRLIMNRDFGQKCCGENFKCQTLLIMSSGVHSTDQEVQPPPVAVVVDVEEWLLVVFPAAPFVDSDGDITVSEVKRRPTLGGTLCPARTALTFRHDIVRVTLSHVVVANQPTGTLLRVVHVDCEQTSSHRPLFNCCT